MARARTRSAATQAHDAAWRALDIETLFAIWHLSRGGLTTLQIGEVLGTHGRSTGQAIKAFDVLMQGPLTIATKVRCGGCGALLVEIPCRLCGWQIERYRITTRGPSC